MTRLDYSIDDLQERKALVEKILEECPHPSEHYLEILADYLIFCMDKQQKRKKEILTDNRLVTVNKRELSMEDLIGTMVSGETGLQAIIAEDKQIIFQPKISITKQDIETIPFIAQVRESILWWQKQCKRLKGRALYVAKQAIIDLRKTQYVIKFAYQKPVSPQFLTPSKPILPLEDRSTVDEAGNLFPQGISLTSPQVCSAILCNYSALKEETWGEMSKDSWALMLDFDRISDKALRGRSLYARIVELKIDGRTAREIQHILQVECGIRYTVGYISVLWRHKIPNIIAAVACEEFLDQYYLNECKGKYKRCSHCGKIKLLIHRYFTKNKTSPDGYYSICRACRNKGGDKSWQRTQDYQDTVKNAKEQ